MIRICSNCGKSNQVPTEHLAEVGRCGVCRAELPPLGEPIETDPETFDRIISGARVPILVDFWAAWCGPCRMAAPEVEKVAAEMAGRAVVLKVDTEKWPVLAHRFHVMTVPNFVVFRNGSVAFQQPGLVDCQQMAAWLRD